MSTLFSGVLILSAIIFGVITGLVIFSIVRYRAKPNDGEPKQTFGSYRLELIWTAIPLVIVGVLFVFTARTIATVDAPQQGTKPPDIVVTGHQWWWEARYSNGAATANEFHIPVGKRLLVRVEAADVIHDFWVPQLARKVDAVPGRPSYIWLQADAAGTYLGACSEYCGTQHAGMRFTVVAQTEPEYTTWLAKQAESAPASALFDSAGCVKCHSLSGIESGPAQGPNLAHVASRLSSLDLARWTANPQSIKPGNHMADQHLSPADATALTKYLETLR